MSHFAYYIKHELKRDQMIVVVQGDILWCSSWDDTPFWYMLSCDEHFDFSC